MPLTHTATFKIRYYECDAYGHLNNTNYVRFFQEAAFEASAAAGYDQKRYAELERLWLVRATQVEYLRPVRYGDTVEVKTWVADFRRISSRRMYELRIAGQDDLAAAGFSDWVYMDTRRNRPVSPPPEMVAAFFPEGAPASFPPRPPFSEQPPPPPGVFTLRRKVAWQEIDSAGMVNNPVYLNYAGECGFAAVAAHGWPWQRMVAQGFAILIRRTQVQYLEPAGPDDELEIATWASDIKRSTALRHYAIHRVSDGHLLARVTTLGVWVDLQSYRPIRIPPEFIRDFAANIVGEAR